MERRILVAVWVTLPLTAGSAAADALDGWSTAPQIVAAVLLWTAWAAALLAVVVPRPIGLTVVRAVAPLPFALIVVLLLTYARFAATRRDASFRLLASRSRGPPAHA